MKRFFTIVLFLLFCVTVTFAEQADICSLSDEELQQRKMELLSELAAVNSEINRRATDSISTIDGLEESVTIRSLFPDIELAKLVRDELSKSTVDDYVTQTELDSIDTLGTYVWGDSISDLTGIAHLRNLQRLTIHSYTGESISEELMLLPKLSSLTLRKYRNTTLPDWFTELKSLRSIDFSGSLLEYLPDNIGELSDLYYIEMAGARLRSLPESIGELINLKQLYLASTWIKSLPDSLGNCTLLEALDIKNTDVSEIPASVRNLNITYLTITNTKIE